MENEELWLRALLFGGIVRKKLPAETASALNQQRAKLKPEALQQVMYEFNHAVFEKEYTIGLSNFHSYKPDYIMQEIYARIILYNVTETIINHTIVEKHETKHSYKVNFTVAAHISRIFLRLTTKEDSIDVMKILQSELIPVRDGPASIQD